MAADRLQSLVHLKARAEAFEEAYPLLFARAMTNVLTDDYAASFSNVSGTRVDSVEAVVLEPVSTHLGVGLLIFSSFSAVALHSENKRSDSSSTIRVSLLSLCESSELTARLYRYPDVSHCK
jgi:hypothetical protein